MKSTLTHRLLQHLVKKKQDGGFTLIELLVVIIIIGILAAIALPAFLNQANRARQTEAATYVGSINRGQQAYRLEKPTFSETVSDLGLGIKVNTTYYQYGDGAGANGVPTGTANETVGLGTGATAFIQGAGIYAAPKEPNLLGFAGAAYTLKDSGGNATTTAILCTLKKDPAVPTGKAPTVTAQNLGLGTASVTSTDGDCN